MMKGTTHFHKQPLVTKQDVFHVPILVALSLLFSLAPTLGFGQPPPGNMFDNFSLDNSAPPVIPAAPTPTTFTQPEASPYPSYPPATDSFTLPDVPASTAAPASPITASQFQQPAQTPAYQPEQYQLPASLPQREPIVPAAMPSEHPFLAYWGVPNDPQTKITGKPMSVAELFTGTRSSAARCQLLQAYWELSGLLAVYHFRCETEKLATGTGGATQDGMINLLREQRRTAEIEFVKQQWVLAELLKQFKGRSLRASELPIPADFPLYPRYQTYAEQIARTERTQYLGRMIPIQEQLIESKNGTWKAALEMLGGSQPFFMAANQRTTAFLDLTKAIVEYNKMIAEYATETISPNVSQRQLVGAVVRLPKNNAANTVAMADPTQIEPGQLDRSVAVSDHYTRFSEVPTGVSSQPVERFGSEYQATPASVVIPASLTIPKGNITEWIEHEDFNDLPEPTLPEPPVIRQGFMGEVPR